MKKKMKKFSNNSPKEELKLEYSKFQNLTIGFISGLNRTWISYPFDHCRTRFQTKKLVYSKNTFRLIYEIIKREGFLGLYRGFEYYGLGIVIGQSIFWPIYMELSSYIQKKYKKERSSIFVIAPSVFVAFQGAMIFRCPFNFIKTKLQAKSGTIIEILKNERILNYYTGFFNVEIISLQIILNFFFYEKIKKLMLDRLPSKMLAIPTASFLSYFLASGIFYPNLTLLSNKRVYGNEFSIAKFASKPKRFYYGFRSNVYIGCSQSIAMFSTFELLKKVFEQINSKKKHVN